MTCRDAAALLHGFVAGSLPLVRRQALANHLRECATCTQALKEVRCTRRLLRRLPRERMPDPMKNSLLDELRKSRKLPSPARPASPSHSPPHFSHHAATNDERSTPGGH
jgi:anti-sigma factor RsiW